MCSTLHPVLAGKLFYIRLLAGKKIAELGLLVKLTLVPLRWIETRLNFLGAAWTKEEKMKHLMTFHTSLIVGKWTFLNAFLGSVEHL